MRTCGTYEKAHNIGLLNTLDHSKHCEQTINTDIVVN